MIERYSYDPYGNVTVLNADGTTRGDGTVASSFDEAAYLHQGLQLDAADGLYDDRDRSYDPSLGRFLQEDPARYGDGPNLNQVDLSNPLAFVDPAGRSANSASPFDPGSILQPITSLPSQIVGQIDILKTSEITGLKQDAVNILSFTSGGNSVSYNPFTRTASASFKQSACGWSANGSATIANNKFSGYLGASYSSSQFSISAQNALVNGVNSGNGVVQINGQGLQWITNGNWNGGTGNVNSQFNYSAGGFSGLTTFQYDPSNGGLSGSGTFQYNYNSSTNFDLSVDYQNRRFSGTAAAACKVSNFSFRSGLNVSSSGNTNFFGAAGFQMSQFQIGEATGSFTVNGVVNSPGVGPGNNRWNYGVVGGLIISQ